MPDCTKCGAKLVSGSNWYPSLERRNLRECAQCRKAATAKWAKANPEKMREIRRRGIMKNPRNKQDPEVSGRAARRYRERYPERVREATRRWANANRERVRESKKKYEQTYRERRRVLERVRYERDKDKINARRRRRYAENSAAIRARVAQRRAGMTLHNTADKTAIAAIYRLAEHVSRLTGVQYHVDHIVPLAKGGIHHERNLCIMRADLNYAKCDRDWPELRTFLEAPPPDDQDN